MSIHPRGREGAVPPLIFFGLVLVAVCMLNLSSLPFFAAPIAAQTSAPTPAVSSPGLSTGSIFAESDADMQIPGGAIGWGGSAINAGGAPPDAAIAYIDVAARVQGVEAGQIDLRYYPSTLTGHQESASSLAYHADTLANPGEFFAGLDRYAGFPVNGQWWLAGKSSPSGAGATIDYWSARLFYGYQQWVNAGGGSADPISQGNILYFAADKQYIPGMWGYVNGSTRTSTMPVTCDRFPWHNPDVDYLLQTERYWTSSATPGYTFNVPNGRYKVVLYFAETQFDSAGRRKFSVRLEGNTVLGGFDIYAAAGGKNQCVVTDFFVNVNDGYLDIDFIKLAGYDNPKINAIQVIVAPSPPASTPTATATRTGTPTPLGIHEVTIPAIADTMTSQGSQANNYGTANPLYAGFMQQLRSWFKFNPAAAGIPANAEILSADVVLWHSANGNLSLYAYAPLADWSETTLTWRGQPDVDPSPLSVMWLPVEAPAYTYVNVTTLARQWLRGERPNNGIMLTDRDNATSATFLSRETANERQRPMLRIRYLEAGQTTPSKTPTPAQPGATATQTNSPTPTLSPTPTNTPPLYLQRVNAGGPAYTDVHGNLWAADRPFSAGGWGYAGGDVYATTASIAGTDDDKLYQSERFWPDTATPGYRFTVPPGFYQVTLKFAEIYRSTAETRRFNVCIENTPILTGYDPISAAGGKNVAAPDVTLVLPVSDGELDICFTRLPGFDGPKISAIEVIGLGMVAATQTPTVTATPVPGLMTATPTATSTRVVYNQRVNAGGAAYTDTAGQMWAADKPFVLGGWGYVGGDTYSTAKAIANSDDDPLYQSERYWPGSGTPGYRFTVPPGTYNVTLKFAEIYRTGAWTRRFDVAINGVKVLSGYDPFLVAGGKDVAAPDVTVTVNADGTVAIDFLALPGYDVPKVSAIAIVQQ